MLTITFPPSATIKILNGANWGIWSSRMLALLQMNGLRSHITGTEPNLLTTACVMTFPPFVLLDAYRGLYS